MDFHYFKDVQRSLSGNMNIEDNQKISWKHLHKVVEDIRVPHKLIQMLPEFLCWYVREIDPFGIGGEK